MDHEPAENVAADAPAGQLTKTCAVCGARNAWSAATCLACGESFEEVGRGRGDEPEGIGGWLILVAIGMVLRPPLLLYYALAEALPTLTGDQWEAITTPGSPVYHPLFGPLAILIFAGNLAFGLWGIVLAIQFFRKKRSLPAMAVAYLLTNCALVIAAYVMAMQIPFVAENAEAESSAEVVRTIVYCAIWVPYFCVSKRVKATFVR